MVLYQVAVCVILKPQRGTRAQTHKAAALLQYCTIRMYTYCLHLPLILYCTLTCALTVLVSAGRPRDVG